MSCADASEKHLREGGAAGARRPRRRGGAGGAVVDLMAALEASVAKARESRGEDAGPGTVHETPKPKKAPAKETAAPTRRGVSAWITGLWGA